jgi:hypothetical protein
MIIKIKKRELPYSQIDNRVINDSRLSWKARGILIYLLSKPDDWEVSFENLINNSPDGRQSLQTGFRELKKMGYAEMKVSRDFSSGKIQGKHWVIFEEPNRKRENHLTVNPSDGKSACTNKDETNKEIVKGEDLPGMEETDLPHWFTPAHHQAWDDYQKMRKESRKKITPTARRRLIKKMIDHGPEWTLAALNHSADSDYQGLFAPKGFSAVDGKIKGDYSQSEETIL